MRPLGTTRPVWFETLCVLTYSARSFKESCRTPITKRGRNWRKQTTVVWQWPPCEDHFVRQLVQNRPQLLFLVTSKDVYVFPWTKVPSLTNSIEKTWWIKGEFFKSNFIIVSGLITVWGVGDILKQPGPSQVSKKKKYTCISTTEREFVTSW
jgi:hypothetical protein